MLTIRTMLIMLITSLRLLLSLILLQRLIKSSSFNVSFIVIVTPYY
jgi:hypothetical protein